jgi:hypothetical protein
VWFGLGVSFSGWRRRVKSWGFWSEGIREESVVSLSGCIELLLLREKCEPRLPSGWENLLGWSLITISFLKISQGRIALAVSLQESWSMGVWIRSHAGLL